MRTRRSRPGRRAKTGWVRVELCRLAAAVVLEVYSELQACRPSVRRHRYNSAQPCGARGRVLSGPGRAEHSLATHVHDRPRAVPQRRSTPPLSTYTHKPVEKHLEKLAARRTSHFSVSALPVAIGWSVTFIRSSTMNATSASTYVYIPFWNLGVPYTPVMRVCVYRCPYH